MDFISIILLIGLAQSVFLMGTVLADRQRFLLPNLLLLVLLFTFTWYQLEFLLLRETLDSQIPFLYSTRYGSWLLVGPLVLLYNRSTLIKGFEMQWRHVWHFLPFVILTLLIPLLNGDVITQRATHYGMLTVFDAYNQESITVWHYLYGSIFILQFVHTAAYIFWAYRETRQIKAAGKKLQSSGLSARIRTLEYLHLSALVIIVLCSAFVLYIFGTTMWKRNMDYLYVLPMLVLVFGLAYRAMKYPNSVLIFATAEKMTPKYARSGLGEEDKRKFLQKLENELTEEKIYRNNELRLADLAEKVGISSHHLSQLINEEKQQNFFDFINGYRVEEAKQRIASGKEQTLLSVAYEVGFNNKNSFNSAFKKRTGMTPSAYRKQVLNAR